MSLRTQGIAYTLAVVLSTRRFIVIAPQSCHNAFRMSAPTVNSSAADRAAASETRAERAREHRAALSGPPGRDQDRCYELSKKSLRCQMDAQIKLNQMTQTSEVLRICKYDEHAKHNMLVSFGQRADELLLLCSL